MALTLAPVEFSWGLLRNVFSLSFDRLVMAHRNLGRAVLAVTVLHGVLETLTFFQVNWQLARPGDEWSTAISETWQVMTEVKITAWGAGNLFGLLAFLSLLVLAVGVLIRRRTYE